MSRTFTHFSNEKLLDLHLTARDPDTESAIIHRMEKRCPVTERDRELLSEFRKFPDRKKLRDQIVARMGVWIEPIRKIAVA